METILNYMTIPLTGDEGIPWYIYLLLVASIALIVGIVIFTKKKK